VNSPTMNMDVQVSLSYGDFIFLDIYPEVGQMDSMVDIYCYFFEELTNYCPQWLY
jgi:hypothetical protein